MHTLGDTDCASVGGGENVSPDSTRRKKDAGGRASVGEATPCVGFFADGPRPWRRLSRALRPPRTVGGNGGVTAANKPRSSGHGSINRVCPPGTLPLRWPRRCAIESKHAGSIPAASAVFRGVESETALVSRLEIPRGQIIPEPGLYSSATQNKAKKIRLMDGQKRKKRRTITPR